MNDSKSTLRYRDAGVDIDAGNALVERIKPTVRNTQRPEVLGGLGGFGALFQLPLERYQQPLLVAGTDGVGTKLLLARESQQHDSIGIDLVAMCVNDVIVQGAEPLFFLDYYATGQLDVDTAASVIEGIAHGCQLAGAALIGGETAEMPGMYAAGDYDLAGFCVGIVERSALIDGSQAKPGDVLLGLPSSGPHANGYSLIRRVLAQSNTDLNIAFGDSSLRDALLAPTKIYVKPILKLLQHQPIAAIAHITGGGLLENLPRVLPATTRAIIDSSRWEWPPIFQWLAKTGNIDTDEMYRTFNCGIGMVLCVNSDSAETVITQLTELGETAIPIGHLASRTAEQAAIQII